MFGLPPKKQGSRRAADYVRFSFDFQHGVSVVFSSVIRRVSSMRDLRTFLPATVAPQIELHSYLAMMCDHIIKLFARSLPHQCQPPLCSPRREISYIHKSLVGIKKRLYRISK